MAKEFTLAEVAEHKTRDDCWVAIFGKVYNVTTFLDEHPGGDEILLKASGKDATDDFDDIGHTHDAWALLEKYYIGEVNKSTIPTKIIPSTHPAGVDTKGKKSKYMAYLVQFLVPLIILNVVVALFSKSSA